MAEVRIQSVYNKYGIRVKRCCASCGHKCILNDGDRLCAIKQIIVGQKFRCKKWVMNGLENAGKGGGDVRQKDTKEVLF